MNPLRVYDYLTLSRGHLFGWVRPLSDAQYRQEHPIGLGSLARTLHHVKGAEWCYIERVRGRQGALGPFSPDNDPETTHGAALGFEDLERSWLAQSAQTRASLEAVTDWETARVCTTVWEGREHRYSASASDLFAQLALHEVHHRAQAMHMLRRLGVETGEIDYNALMWAPVDGG